MFNEQLVITLVTDQDPVLDITESNTGNATINTAALISAANLDDRVDLVIVVSTNPEVLELAHTLDAVNREATLPKFGTPGSAQALHGVLTGEDGEIEDDAWVVYLEPKSTESNAGQLLAQAFDALSNSDASSATVNDAKTNNTLLHVFKAGALKTALTFPVGGSVSVLV